MTRLDSICTSIATRLLATSGVVVNGPNPWDPKINDPTLFRRAFFGEASIVLGEGFMHEQWTCAQVDELIARVLSNRLSRLLFSFSDYVSLPGALRGSQDTTSARANVAHHYDIGEKVYDVMLGTGQANKLDRLYTCARFDLGAGTIAEAQLHKVRLIGAKLDLKPGMKVLDIGGGWGALAFYLAETYGVDMTIITLSENQAAYAHTYMCSPRKGSVTVRIQDYRDVCERFDRIVSIGMFEAVGREHFRTYMEMAARCLTEDGRFVFHTIHGPDQNPWIQKYIFPGGVLPSQKEILRSVDGLFHVWDTEEIGVNYAPTLRAWREHFVAGWDQLHGMYDDVFYRMWLLYLALCEGVFRSRYAGVVQHVFAKHVRPADYVQIRTLEQCP